MIELKHLSENDRPALEEFCRLCELAGFKNNASPRLMKFGAPHDIGYTPEFWAVCKDNKIISVSGCHLWPDEVREPTTLRCLFRSATLPEYANIVRGLSRNHMNSMPFSIMMPFQIRWGLQHNCKEFYITTSHDPSNDMSGKMNRTHRALELLAKNGIVKYHRVMIAYHVPQTLWRINLEAYYNILKTFDLTRQQLNITGLEEEYKDILENGFSIASV